ncbi:MAG: AAA family ATPase [Thermoguttaceae bacterium]|nr:AAA family ATPase [Thermoguttaceae bacterium]
MPETRENKDVRGPFLTAPDPRAYYPASSIERARRAVVRCARRNEGVALVVGGTGVGKTLLARAAASEFESEDPTSIVTATRGLDVKSFYQQFLFGLHQGFSGCDETEVRLMALDYLANSRHGRCVLFVDDAQYLSPRVFDELRGLIDQASGASKRLAVALFGSSRLEDRLNLPILFPFQQRIVSRSYLEVFTQAETAGYVESELARTGVAIRFDAGAKDAIAKLSGGSPRVVAQLCDRAAFLASGGELTYPEELEEKGETAVPALVDERVVERAWNDLQNIPEEPEETAIAVASGEVVEFGELDDEKDEREERDETRESAIEFSSELKDEEEGEEQVEAPVVALDEAKPVEARESSEEGVEESTAETSPKENSPEDPEKTPEKEPEPKARFSFRRPFGRGNGSTVFVAGFDFAPGRKEPEVDEEVEDELEEPGEIDDDLDARLRAKFGFDSEPSESEPVKRARPTYEFRRGGLRFEARNGSELAAEDRLDAIAKFVAEKEASEKDAREFPERAASDSVYEYDEGLEMKASGSGSTTHIENPKSSTRRPIEGGEDGSREYREQNGFDAEDAAKVAISQPEPGETELSLADKAHSQIASRASGESEIDERDKYLGELDELEREIAEEADLIRRIRDVHRRLKESVEGSGRDGNNS